MNPRSRVAEAMRAGIPDRVPLMCQVSIGHMLLNLEVAPDEFWNDAEVFAGGLARLRSAYDFDGILVSLHGHDPHWRSRVASREEGPGGVTIRWTDGSSTRYPPDELPIHSPVGAPESADPNVPDPGEIPAVLSYIPVSQGLRFELRRDHLFDSLRLTRQLAGEEISLHGEVTSPFDYFLDLRGHVQGLMALLDAPDEAHAVLTRYATLVRGLALEMCATGVDAIKISSPFAGAGFISRTFYRSFVLPYERLVAEAVRARGVHVYTHTCGAVGDRLDLLMASGVSGIECLDPPPLGDVELEEAKLAIGARGFIKGNIDSVNTLLRGTPDEILADARRRLEIGRQGGGFILSTACSIAPHVPAGSILILREAVERWGRI